MNLCNYFKRTGCQDRSNSFAQVFCFCYLCVFFFPICNFCCCWCNYFNRSPNYIDHFLSLISRPKRSCVTQSNVATILMKNSMYSWMNKWFSRLLKIKSVVRKLKIWICHSAKPRDVTVCLKVPVDKIDVNRCNLHIHVWNIILIMWPTCTNQTEQNTDIRSSVNMIIYKNLKLGGISKSWGGGVNMRESQIYI